MKRSLFPDHRADAINRGLTLAPCRRKLLPFIEVPFRRKAAKGRGEGQHQPLVGPEISRQVGFQLNFAIAPESREGCTIRGPDQVEHKAVGVGLGWQVQDALACSPEVLTGTRPDGHCCRQWGQASWIQPGWIQGCCAVPEQHRRGARQGQGLQRSFRPRGSRASHQPWPQPGNLVLHTSCRGCGRGAAKTRGEGKKKLNHLDKL